MGLAIQLLQCKPEGFIPQKINSVIIILWNFYVHVQVFLFSVFNLLKPDFSFFLCILQHLPLDIQNKLRSTYMRLESNSDSEGSTNGTGMATNKSYSALPNRSDSPSVNNSTFQASSVAFSLKANGMY